jgi:catechol 2,3-dioxygenase-like lactoylglutathione lyase family enzyme
MAITNVQVLSVPVSDQDRAKAFYADVLGFQVLADNPMGPGQRWVQLAPPGAQTSVTLVTWFENMPPGSLSGLVLQSSELEADRASLMAGGAQVSEIEDQPWGSFFTSSDPDGNGLVIRAAAS